VKAKYLNERNNKMKVHVGGLPYSLTEEEFAEFFSQAGEVKSAIIIRDKFNNNRSKGFGFVEFETEDAVNAAINDLSGKELGGRTIVVNKAMEKKEGDRRDGGFNRGGGDRRGSYGGGRDNRGGNRDSGFRSFRER
jgi:RNA recognition motif-containing protein